MRSRCETSLASDHSKRRDGASASTSASPGTQVCRGAWRWCRWNGLASRRRHADAPSRLLAPLCRHVTVGVLSDPTWQVFLRMLTCSAKTDSCRMVAANSRSEFVMSPEGLLSETRRHRMCCGAFFCQTMGGVWSVPNHTPPKSMPLASTRPLQSPGKDGKSSAVFVGRRVTSSAMW